jgi:hypothetical protein
MELLKIQASTLGRNQKQNEGEGGNSNGESKQRRKNDRSEEARGQGTWWKRTRQDAQDRQAHHEDLIARSTVVQEREVVF